MKQFDFRLTIGTLCWVLDDNGCIKLIEVEDIVWDNDSDCYGWNIVSGEFEYWVESCYHLEYIFSEN